MISMSMKVDDEILPNKISAQYFVVIFNTSGISSLSRDCNHVRNGLKYRRFMHVLIDFHDVTTEWTATMIGTFVYELSPLAPLH